MLNVFDPSRAREENMPDAPFSAQWAGHVAPVLGRDRGGLLPGDGTMPVRNAVCIAQAEVSYACE